MIFKQLFDRVSSSYSYLIADEKTKQAAFVDPVMTCLERDLALIHDLNLQLIYTLETHVHSDRVTSAFWLRQATQCQIIIPAGSKVTGADVYVNENECMSVGVVPISVIATPGHTDAHVAFYVNNDRLLTGEGLLIRGCGRTDQQNGDAGLLYDSVVAKLFHLPEMTLVYPGRDDQGRASSTIGEEKKCNRRFQRNRQEFIALMQKLALPLPPHSAKVLQVNSRCGQNDSLS